MNKSNESYYGRLLHVLVSSPFKRVAYILSDGGTHLLGALLVICITATLWYQQVNAPSEEQHNFALNISQIGYQGGMPDSLKQLSLSFNFESQDITNNTNGKYRSSINISYARNNPSDNIDTVSISLYPILEDYTVSYDTIVYDYEAKEVAKDTTLYFKHTPKKNVPRLIGGMREARQNITIFSNELGIKEGGHYYNYFINFGFLPTTVSPHDSLYDNCQISFAFGDLKNKNGFYYSDKSIRFNYIYPEPDVLNNGYIYYKTPEKIQQVRNNHGILIQAEDMELKKRNERKAFVGSVLIGTGIAFLLDILIQLIKELRNFNLRDDQEKRRMKKESESS